MGDSPPKLPEMGFVDMKTEPPVDEMATHFVTTWKTDNPGETGATSIHIGTGEGTFDYDVDWDNDGVFDEEGGLTGDVTHDFGMAGTYTVRIRGEFPHMIAGKSTSSANNALPGDANKLLAVEQWGTMEWGSMHRMFEEAVNPRDFPSDAPDLSRVTDMSRVFAGSVFSRSSFNQDIGNWDVSNVTNMSQMFRNAYVFNQDIGGWDVSNVTDMSEMFGGAAAFKQDLSRWDVSSVTNMSEMFGGARAFGAGVSSQGIGGWDVSNVTTMRSMFEGANTFNQDIGAWDISNVTNMSWMFGATQAFNQDIGGWNVSNVTEMRRMFESADAFNQDIGGWDVSNMNGMLNATNGLSTSTYDAILIGWSSRSDLERGVTLGATMQTYCTGEAARQDLITMRGWTITGDTKQCL